MEGMTMAEHLTRPAEAVPTLHSQPWLHQHGKEIQAFGTVRQFPLALSHETRMYSCQRLNQILTDTQILYALYKKHHWPPRLRRHPDGRAPGLVPRGAPRRHPARPRIGTLAHTVTEVGGRMMGG